MSSSGYQYLDATGVIVPDTSDLETTVQTEFAAAIPGLTVTADDTPQGVLITAEVTNRAEVVANNAAIANQINPNISGGVCLEALCALTGFDPDPATPSVIPGVTVAGVAATLIPAGSQARTTAGDIFATVADVTLDGSGNGTVDFQAVVDGPIAAAANTLINIVTDVLGWETVTNSVAATPGLLAPSDAQLRAQRNSRLALQGQSLPEAMTSAMAEVPGVNSFKFLENVENTTETISTISLVAKSIWFCIDGGTDLDVATSILASKSGGCNYNGAVSQAVVEPASGQTYTILFDRPTVEPVAAQVTVKLPPTGVQSSDVVAAVLAYAAGQLDNYPGFVVGASVSPFEIGGAVTSQIAGIYVQKVEVKLVASGSFQTTELALPINEQATLISSNINVITI